MKIELCHPSRCTAKVPDDLEKEYLIAEPKMDGSRYLFYIGCDPYERREGNALLSRRESSADNKYCDKTDNVPHMTLNEYEGLEGTVLDGEIMHKDFLATNSIMNSSRALAIEKQDKLGNLEYFAFDVLFFRGKDLRSMPLSQRRKVLEKVVEKMDNPFIKAIEQFVDNFSEHFKRIVEENGEGIIVKDLRLGYGAGWAKLKRSVDVSCVISGFKEGTNKYKGMVGSLALSVYKDGVLTEVGFASGFDDKLRIDMSKNFDKYKGRVVEIFAQEIQKIDKKNPAGRLRHPTFHRMRSDMNPEECTSEKLFEDLKTNIKSKRVK